MSTSPSEKRRTGTPACLRQMAHRGRRLAAATGDNFAARCRSEPPPVRCFPCGSKLLKKPQKRQGAPRDQQSHVGFLSSLRPTKEANKTVSGEAVGNDARRFAKTCTGPNASDRRKKGLRGTDRDQYRR
jgi:hypothetical protein